MTSLRTSSIGRKLLTFGQSAGTTLPELKAICVRSCRNRWFRGHRRTTTRSAGLHGISESFLTGQVGWEQVPEVIWTYGVSKDLNQFRSTRSEKDNLFRLNCGVTERDCGFWWRHLSILYMTAENNFFLQRDGFLDHRFYVKYLAFSLVGNKLIIWSRFQIMSLRMMFCVVVYLSE